MCQAIYGQFESLLNWHGPWAGHLDQLVERRPGCARTKTAILIVHVRNQPFIL
jgi:hypothetical protein